MTNLIFICVGGFFGAASRYLLGIFITGRRKGDFPMGTFTVNILGSFLLGLIYFHPQLSAALGNNLKQGLGIGFLGAFTTFSTLEYEAMQLLKKKKKAMAFFYIILSIVTGLTAAWATRLF